jgi:acyl dehydratase
VSVHITDDPSAEPEFQVPVEHGMVLAFWRALTVGLPAGSDLAPSVSTVLPTYVVVADHFDPSFARRPQPGAAWQGSGATPSGLAPDDPAHVSHLHVGQEITFTRPLVLRDRVRARRLAPRRWTKQGRSGRLEFTEHVTELVDHHDGSVIVESRWLDVDPERGHQSVTTGQRAEAQAAPRPPGRELLLVENLTRTQIAMYAGASGDFHPLHHDDVYARDRGYPGCFCPGMLTMGLAGLAVVDAIDVDRLSSFSGRFAAQVWPGDSLRAFVDVTATDAGGRATALAIAVHTQHDVPVFTGRATARSRS